MFVYVIAYFKYAWYFSAKNLKKAFCRLYYNKKLENTIVYYLDQTSLNFGVPSLAS